MGNGDLHARLIKNDILKAGVKRMDEIRARIATISDPRHRQQKFDCAENNNRSKPCGQGSGHLASGSVH